MVRKVKAWALIGEKNTETIGNIVMITKKRETARARNRWNKNCNYPCGKVVPCEIVIKTKAVKK